MIFNRNILQRRWRIRLERFPRMRKVGYSNPSRDRPKRQAHIGTALLLSALQFKFRFECYSSIRI